MLYNRFPRPLPNSGYAHSHCYGELLNYPINSINHAYLGSSVYATLREALITGRLKPNDRLRIRELAEQVGTSVTPVRDAILQLAKEQAL